MPKCFSVVAEMEDGKKTLPVRGKSSSDVFQMVKALPGVRRVGKVTEISEAAHDALVHGKPHADPPHKPHADRPHAEPTHKPHAAHPAHPARPDHRAGTRHVISGPRVVHSGQPFRHLQPPPERPELRTPTKEQSRQARAVVRAREQAAAPRREYRIIKSRRVDGLPFLLQRGNFHMQKGKRIFTVDWEKGFADKEQAQKHEQWVKLSEQEMADVDQH